MEKYGKIPGEDSIVARRISGPGVDRSYFYSVKPNVALGGVLAALEKTRVQMSLNGKLVDLRAPRARANQIIGMLKVLFGENVAASNTAPFMQDIAATEGEIKTRLDADFGSTLATIGGWESLPYHAQNRIRLEKQDLELLKSQATALVQAFVTENILAKLSESGRQKFWRDLQVPDLDWSAYAEHLLISIFGRQILTALDEEAKEFVISVRETRVDDWLDDVLHRYIPRTEPLVIDATVRESEPVAVPSIRDTVPVVQLVGARDLCSGMLLAPSSQWVDIR